MNRPRHRPHLQLFEPIAEALEKNGRLSQAILEFIDTSLFPAQPERLAAFLTGNHGESERDSLLDLIFSPDLAVQLSLEPLLEAACCTPDDETVLLDRLLASPIHAPITMPDGTELACIPVPDFIKSQYLERLSITWRLDPRVRAAIDQNVADAAAPKVKVRLRNGHLRPSACQQTILCRFFERMADDDPDYPACLDLFLSRMEEAAGEGDFYDHLVAHKRFLFRGLRQAQRFEALRRQSNMETLMLQGVRAPHASRDELIYHMRLIDLICAGMFGKTEAIAAPMEDPLRIVTDLQNPAAAVRSLIHP